MKYIKPTVTSMKSAYGRKPLCLIDHISKIGSDHNQSALRNGCLEASPICGRRANGYDFAKL